MIDWIKQLYRRLDRVQARRPVRIALTVLAVGVVAAVFLLAGIGLLYYLYATLVAPWHARRRAGDTARPGGSSAVGAHQDRGDGYCAHCYQPWPCAAARV